jgi:hypothetical protein
MQTMTSKKVKSGTIDPGRVSIGISGFRAAVLKFESISLQRGVRNELLIDAAPFCGFGFTEAQP